MITLIRKYARKWLIAIALAARNLAEATASRLISSDQRETGERQEKNRTKNLPTNHFGGPPEHWIRLVKQHAPELLNPSPLYRASQEESQIFERNIGPDDEYGETDTPEPELEKKEVENFHVPGNGPFQVNVSHPSQESASPSTSNIKKTENDSIQSAENDLKFPEHFQHRKSTVPLKSKYRPGSKSVLQTLPSPKEAKKKSIREPLRLHGKGPLMHLRSPRPASSDEENGLTRKISSKKIQQESKSKFSSDNQTGKQFIQSEPHSKNPQISSGSNTKFLIFRQVKRQPTSKTISGRTGLLKTSKFSPTDETRFLTSKNEQKESDPISPEQVMISNWKKIDQPFEKKEALKEKISRPTELNWPALPGENDSHDDAPDNPDAVWPSLPEESSIGLRSLLDQMEIRLSETESRGTEHLRRLDEEQKGIPWNELHL